MFLHRYRQTAGYGRGIVAGMLAISLGMLAMGIGYTAVANAWADDALKDRMENLLEWHIGLAMTGWFLLQMRIWRLSAFSLSFDAR